MQLQPFEEEARSEYIASYFNSDKESMEKVERFINSNSSVKSISLNPLTLQLIWFAVSNLEVKKEDVGSPRP